MRIESVVVVVVALVFCGGTCGVVCGDSDVDVRADRADRIGQATKEDTDMIMRFLLHESNDGLSLATSNPMPLSKGTRRPTKSKKSSKKMSPKASTNYIQNMTTSTDNPNTIQFIVLAIQVPSKSPSFGTNTQMPMTKSPVNPTPIQSVAPVIQSTRPANPTLIQSVAPVIQSIRPANPTPIQSDAPVIQSTAPIIQTNSSLIPICRVDPTGFFIPPTDRRYVAADTKEITTREITFADGRAAIDDAKDGFEGISTLAGIGDTFEKFSRAASLISGGAGLLSVGFSFIGPLLGMKSQQDQILDAIQSGFTQLNSRLTDVQIEIRTGFQRLAEVIRDVTLDDLAGQIDSTGRMFNNYVNASVTGRTQIYGPKFRAACNEPFKTPEDIFYNLYGYVCTECTFASRKRANFTEIAKKENKLSDTNFLLSFGNFILQGMIQSMFLHEVCLPPLDGSCTDKSTDETYKYTMEKMQLAFAESNTGLRLIATDLSDFAPTLTIEDLLDPVRGGNGDNQKIADNILKFLKDRQPSFHFQILVSSSGDNRNNLWRFSCDINADPECKTKRTGTGHISIDDIEKKAVSIRYRLSEPQLPAAETNVTVGGLELPFQTFYLLLTTRIANRFASEFTTPDCGASADFSIGMRACIVDVCAFNCSVAERVAFQSVVGDSFYTHRIGDKSTDVKVATDNESAFPKVEVNFVTRKRSNREERRLDSFRMYYP
jgi:hypothetical protein